jgi:hypothetical protein
MTVAVVVPIYRSRLTDTETIALTQCCRVLSRHRMIVVAPEGLDLTDAQTICAQSGFSPVLERFPRNCFASKGAYNALLMSRAFFQRFAAWEYVLIHQLDAFVFSDRLQEFCDQGYDYIGAPWVHDANAVRYVGNGGFSLRKVSTALRMLSGPWGLLPLQLGVAWRRLAPLRRVTRWLAHRGVLDRMLVQSPAYLPRAAFDALCINEDLYWGQNCGKLAFYRTAPYAVAVSFAFEMDPVTAFEKNASRLPFGCHAWPRWQPDFWRPHINRFGHAWGAP